jgi:hypothetical protein
VVSAKPAASTGPADGIMINTTAAPGPIRRPAVPLPAANQGTVSPAALRVSWLSRRYAGLPLLVWLASVLLLILPLLVGGWLWFGRSGDHAQSDESMQPDATSDAADTAPVKTPTPQAKPAAKGKPKVPPKPDRGGPPPRKKPAKTADEPSGPSPLDGLDKLTPDGASAAPAPGGT